MGGRAIITNDQTNTWLNENTLTYVKSLGGVHNFTFLAGYTMQGGRFERARASAQGFTNDILTYENLGSGSTALVPFSEARESQLNSYLGRVNYDYAGKYLLTATVRADGASRFGAGNKYAAFPSASVAWRISQEPFLKNSPVLTDLKLRVSYGSSGNQELPSYQSLAILETQNANFNNTVAPEPGQAGWPIPLCGGNDLAVGRGRGRGPVEQPYQPDGGLLQQKTVDLLLRVPVPYYIGYSDAIQNLGSLRNRGVELGINSNNLTGAFKWSTNFNIAANRNKVLELGDRTEFGAGESSGHLQLPNSGVVRVGQPIGIFYGYQTNGIFQNQSEVDESAQKTAKPGDRRYVDQDGNGVLNALDRVILGQAQPKLFGGITNTFSYKGVELSIFIQGVSGNGIFNVNRFELESLTGVSNQSREVLDRWTPENPSTTIPRANAVGNAYVISSRQVEDGSYLRVKNINLSYTLPAALVGRIKLYSVKVYVSAQNWITFTNYSGYDPEVSRFGQNALSLGTDYGSYPANKMVLAGLNISL